MYNHLCHYLADEPEIDVEAEKVHSGVGKEAHLTCIVHGEPRPSVSTCTLIHFGYVCLVRSRYFLIKLCAVKIYFAHIDKIQMR